MCVAIHRHAVDYICDTSLQILNKDFQDPEACKLCVGWYGMAWYGMVGDGMVWNAMVW